MASVAGAAVFVPFVPRVISAVPLVPHVLVFLLADHLIIAVAVPAAADLATAILLLVFALMTALVLTTLLTFAVGLRRVISIGHSLHLQN